MSIEAKHQTRLITASELRTTAETLVRLARMHGERRRKVQHTPLMREANFQTRRVLADAYQIIRDIMEHREPMINDYRVRLAAKGGKA